MIRGSIVALVTPMTKDGQLDIDALRALVEWHIEAGSQGLVVLGTTGEAPTLTADESRAVLQHVIEQAAGRIPVIAGTGCASTQATIEKTQMAHAMGVDCCLLVTPYYNKPTQEGLYQHFKAVAESVAVPIILYNVPGRTQCDLSLETTARLAQIDSIIGLKEASAKLDRVAPLRTACPESFMLYSGDDPTAYEFMRLGGDGVISVTANVFPQQMSELCRLTLSGEQTDLARAQAIDHDLLDLHQALVSESNPIPVKYALHLMKKIDSGIRLPLTWLASDKQAIVQAALSQLLVADKNKNKVIG